MRRRRCHRCAGIFAVIAIAIVALVARRRAGVVVDVDIHRHSRRRCIPLHCRHRCRLRCPLRCHNPCRLCRPSRRRNRRRCRCTSLLRHHRRRRRRRAVAVIVDFVARCAVAIIVDNGKTPVHRQRQQRHRDEGNNAIATTAKSVVSSKSLKSLLPVTPLPSSLTTARRLHIGDNNDAITTRAAALSLRRQRRLHIDGDFSPRGQLTIKAILCHTVKM